MTVRWRAAAAAVVTVAVVLACVGTGTGPPAGAQPGGPDGATPAAAAGAIPVPEPVDSPRIGLRSQTTFVAPGDVFSMDLTLAGVAADATVTISVHPAVTSRIQFGQTLAGEQLGAPLQQLDAVPVALLPAAADDSVRVALGVPATGTEPGPLSLAVTQPGVYPVTVRVDGDDSPPLVSHVVRLADPDGRPATFSVGVLVRLNPPADADGPGVVGAGDVTALAQGLAAVPDVPATVATVPAALAALADSGPDGAGAVAALAAAVARSEVVVDTWVPVDATSLVAGGLERMVDRQLVAGAATLDRLLGVRSSLATWMVSPRVDPEALGLLVTRGVTQVVVPEALAEPLDTDRFTSTLTQPFAVPASAGDDPATIAGLQTDVVLGELWRSSPQPALAANRVLADLAVLALDFPDIRRAAVIDIPAPADTAGAQTLAEVLRGLDQAARPAPTAAPLMTGRTVSALFAATDPVGTVGDGPELVRTWRWNQPRPLGSYPEELAAVDQRTVSMASTILVGEAAPEATATVAGIDRLVLTSGLAGLGAADRTGYLAEADTAVTGTLAPIGVPVQGSVTLTANAGVVPVTVDNGRSEPVRVRLEVDSDKLEFPDGNDLDVTLQPGPNRVEVAVQVRASGGFPVQVAVRTADGAIELGQARFTVRSTAISGVGLALSVLAGGFLAGWWALHFRSARRSRQLVGTDDPAP